MNLHKPQHGIVDRNERKRHTMKKECYWNILFSGTCRLILLRRPHNGLDPHLITFYFTHLTYTWHTIRQETAQDPVERQIPVKIKLRNNQLHMQGPQGIVFSYGFVVSGKGVCCLFSWLFKSWKPTGHLFRFRGPSKLCLTLQRGGISWVIWGGPEWEDQRLTGFISLWLLAKGK